MADSLGYSYSKSSYLRFSCYQYSNNRLIKKDGLIEKYKLKIEDYNNCKVDKVNIDR